MPLPITSQRLHIKMFSEEHAKHPRYIEWLTDHSNLVSLNLIEYLINPVTHEDLFSYFESFQANARDSLFAIHILDNDAFIGTATLREIGYGGLFDLGILIGDKSVRGKGMAREAISCLVRYAFDELNSRKVCSSFSDTNIAVMLAFLKNGFKIEGLQRNQQMALDGTTSNRYIVGCLNTDL